MEWERPVYEDMSPTQVKLLCQERLIECFFFLLTLISISFYNFLKFPCDHYLTFLTFNICLSCYFNF